MRFMVELAVEILRHFGRRFVLSWEKASEPCQPGGDCNRLLVPAWQTRLAFAPVNASPISPHRHRCMGPGGGSSRRGTYYTPRGVRALILPCIGLLPTVCLCLLTALSKTPSFLHLSLRDQPNPGNDSRPVSRKRPIVSTDQLHRPRGGTTRHRPSCRRRAG